MGKGPGPVPHVGGAARPPSSLSIGQSAPGTMGSAMCDPRAVVQLFITGLTLSTAVVAFAFAFVFENYVEQMSENFTGQLRSKNLPCIRATFSSDCDNALVDRCWDYCCPAGYRCARDPIVGLYCQDTTVCGDPSWCKYFADIPGTCRTQMCKDYQMVKRVTKICYILAAVGIVLDLMTSSPSSCCQT